MNDKKIEFKIKLKRKQIQGNLRFDFGFQEFSEDFQQVVFFHLHIRLLR